MVELARTRPDDIVRVDFRKFDGHKDEASSSQNKNHFIFASFVQTLVISVTVLFISFFIAGG